MIAVSVGEAKNKLPYFLHLAEKGESIEITRHGKAVAMLNSHENAKFFSKKEHFLSTLDSWRQRYPASLFENDEIDQIFSRKSSSDSMSAVRHPEDFSI